MALPYTSSFNNTLGFSDTQFQVSLIANIEQTYTVPGNNTKKYVLTFGDSSNATVFVGRNVTATPPASGTSSQLSGVEFITPDMQRYAVGGDVLSFITPDAAGAYVGVSLRAIPN